ncbi:MAG: LacI family DNA-binding transcriptional regulator [Clostridiaceae bacterium]
MTKKVNMDDIAKKLNISKNTVSLALRNMPGISSQTSKLIFDAAKELGYEYKKSLKTSSAKETDSKNICLILSKSIRNMIGFYSYIQMGIEEEAKRNSLNTILYYYDENDENFETPLCIRDGIVSGIITLGHVTRNNLNKIIGYKIPLVAIDEYYDNLNLDYVLTDNLCGGYVATEYLIKHGHRKIGFAGDIHQASSFYDRYYGFLKAMSDHSLHVNSPYTLIDKGLQKFLNKDIAPVVNELKSLPELPTAFFCCNDPEALALYKAFNIMGLRVPDDVSIIGFDNIDSAKNVSPELTTMHVEKELTGIKAVRRLVEKMQDKTGVSQKILIPTTLVERQSVIVCD